MSQKWYSSVSAFKFNDTFNLSIEELQSKLKNKKIIPCDKSSLKTVGWDEIILGDESSITIKASGAYLLNLKVEEKLIPASIVKEAAEKEISIREKKTGSKISKADKEDIKDAIITKMKAHAFIKSSFTLGYLDVKNKKLVVNSSSSAKVDAFTTYLRDTLGSLDIEILKPDLEMQGVLTDVLIDNPKYKKFDIGSDCVLKDFTDGQATIAAKREDLGSDEIIDHITSGKQIENIELIWEKRIGFKISSEFKISGLKPLQLISDEIKDQAGESTDAYAKIQTSMFIMVEDFNELIDDLMELEQ
jgi:recombination associated protein RdgC